MNRNLQRITTMVDSMMVESGRRLAVRNGDSFVEIYDVNTNEIVEQATSLKRMFNRLNFRNLMKELEIDLQS